VAGAAYVLSAHDVGDKPFSCQHRNLSGTLWGGSLNAGLVHTRQEIGAWSSSFKGTLKQADLGLLNGRLGFQGYSIGVGDVEFDLTSPDNKIFSVSGSVGVDGHNLKIDRFNFGKLQEFEK